jgi:hypothetical protein
VLTPKDRTLLLEALRPPDDYRLDVAVCTTYSLDLMAMLVAPLALTFFDWVGGDGEPTRDPNALLEAIRRNVDRIHLFCQAGQIAVPGAYKPLFSYLESAIHEVRPHHAGGVFHPKVWVLRYAAPDEAPKYRLLCASRNLTFDRSWDTLLVLDGVMGRRDNQHNAPLARFIQALPELAVQGLDGEIRKTMDVLAADLGRVEFELPPHVEELRFWPLGLPGGEDQWPFPAQAERGLVIAPFLGANTLKRLSMSDEQTLVSRLDSLALLDEGQLAGYETLALSDGADLEAEDHVGEEDVPDFEGTLSGLHAKLFAFDTDGQGQVWTGSANATSAAFHRNVEFLVEMRGRSRDMGVEAILSPSEKGVNVLRDLLEPFTPQAEGGSDPGQQAVDHALFALRQFVVDQGLAVTTSRVDEDLFNLAVAPAHDTALPDVEFELDCWPLTLKQEAGARQMTVKAGMQLVFPSLSFEALTTFFAFEGRVTAGGLSGTCRFVLNLPGTGFPENRRQRLLQFLLKDRSQVMRYLWLLLAEDGTLSLGDITGSSGSGAMGADGQEGFHADMPMLESLVRALDRNPDKLDQVARFVTELQSTEEGSALLPEDFDQVWKPLWAAREALRQHAD